MILITIYLDRNASECGYKYVVTKGSLPWTAYRTDDGFRNFMSIYGLKIDTSKTQLKDRRDIGKGRLILATCVDRKVENKYFWDMPEIPTGANRFVALCNGEYVNCYAVTDDAETTIYRPNPNAKSVYIPYDYFAAAKIYG